MTILFTDGKFREGVGTFDYSSKSFDEVLIISSIGIIAFIISGYIRQLFFSYPLKIHNKSLFKIKSRNFIKNFLIIILLFVLIVSGLNFFFKIYQKGLVPIENVNFFISGFVKWMLLFGLSSIISILLYYEFIIKKKFSWLTIFLAVFETFLSSLTMLSRGMIFNSFSTFYGIYNFSNKTNNKLSIKFYLKYILLILFFFYISIMTVNHLRVKYFYVGKSYIETKTKVTNNINNETLKEDIRFDVAQSNSEILYLLVNRWVGIDSIMAINAKKEILSFGLIKESFKEKFELKGLPFYERKFELISRDNFKQYDNVKGNTLTGIIGFLYYTGSYTFLFFSLITLSIVACLIEYFAFKISSYNLIFSSIIGQIIAFRYVHFGYLPSNSYLLFSTIIITIILVYITNNLLKKFFSN